VPEVSGISLDRVGLSPEGAAFTAIRGDA